MRLIIDGRRRQHIIISPPLIAAEYSPTPQFSPFFTTSVDSTSPIDAVTPIVNPASSIEELLQAYGVKPGPVRCRIPPPPARAIFPQDYHVITRIHVRSRPGSSRPFSRASNRLFNPRQSPSISSSRRSNASSGILGLAILNEELPSPFIRIQNSSTRPGTAGSTAPKLRSRQAFVEVVSCATQTSPPPTPNVSSTPDERIVTQGPSPVVVERAPTRPRKRGKRSRAKANNVNIPGSGEQQTTDNNGGNPQRARRRRKRRDQSIQCNAEAQTSNMIKEKRSVSNHQNDRIAERDSISSEQISVTDIGNVSEAMEEYYRSQGQLHLMSGGFADSLVDAQIARNSFLGHSAASSIRSHSPMDSIKQDSSLRREKKSHTRSNHTTIASQDYLPTENVFE